MPRRPSIGRDVPTLGDPSWPSRCAPLLEFLEEPRNWEAIKVWGKNHKVTQYMLRNMVAWLEEKWKIRQDPDTRRWEAMKRRT